MGESVAESAGAEKVGGPALGAVGGPAGGAMGGAGAGTRAGLRAAAFYDLDGTLVEGNVISHYVYFAMNARSPGERAGRLLGLAARAPWFVAQNRLDRRLFNEAFYRSYRGASEDRLRVLASELFERVTRPAIFAGARELVAADRAAGRLTVLVSGALDIVAEPLARHLGIERCFANRLRIAGEARLATGELEPPVLAGPGKVRFLRELAEREGLDLGASRAYADDAADVPFLSAVGHPVAVNPERALRATAVAHRWPILELGQAGARASAGRPGRGGLFDRALDGALSVLRMVEASR